MSFLILKPDYPHKGGATNALFSVKHGEILECPESYDPDPGTFLIFDTREEAQAHLVTPKAAAPSGAVSPAGHKPYPMFRRVMSVSGPPIDQLFDRDLYGFLNREWQDVVMDINIMNIERECLERMLKAENKHSRRKNVIVVIEDKIKKAPKAKKPEPKKKMTGEEMTNLTLEEKYAMITGEEVKAAPGVTTKGFTKPKAEAVGEAKAEIEAQDEDVKEEIPKTLYTPPAVENVPTVTIADAEPQTFRQLLRAVSGIGKATTDDILAVYPDMEALQKDVKGRKKLPFRDDVAKLLRQNFSPEKK